MNRCPVRAHSRELAPAGTRRMFVTPPPERWRRVRQAMFSRRKRSAHSQTKPTLDADLKPKRGSYVG